MLAVNIPVSRRIFQPPPNNLNKAKRRRIIFWLAETPPNYISANQNAAAENLLASR